MYRSLTPPTPLLLQKSGCYTLESGPVKTAVLRDLGLTVEPTCAATHNAIAAPFKALRVLYCVNHSPCKLNCIIRSVLAGQAQDLIKSIVLIK
jgi:hypothetical protein